TQQYLQFEDKPAYDQVDALATRYIDLFISGQVDEVRVVYQRFLSPARQVPVTETLLPLSSVTVQSAKSGANAADANKTAGPKTDYEFMPSAEGILGSLVPVAFKVRLFKCFLDAAVSEQIARRVAMKAATENAGDLIKSVSRLYNRTRQANITKEISELIAGSEALK
ncbi:MAG: F0F1 ATP synthase subunit gamma, partial [Gemmataceae bacterium]